MKDAPKVSRRKFLGQLSCAAVSSTAFYSTLLNLRMTSSAAAQALDPLGTAASDYKVLVCLFLDGGIDSYNLLVPYGDDEYKQYREVRNDLALSKSAGDILPLNYSDGQRTYGVHYTFSEIERLFRNGKAAWVTNVGTLIEPTTKQQFLDEAVRLPRGIYSHSDQRQQWHTALPQENSGFGWAGATADLLASLNESERISMNISLDGVNIWQTGNESFAYAISTDGSKSRSRYDRPWGVNPARATGIDTQLGQSYHDLFTQTFADISQDAIAADQAFSAAVDAVPEFATQFPETHLGDRLKMIAKTIAAHEDLGMRRQTFYARRGGWDHHDVGLGDFNAMMEYEQIAESIAAFQAAMEEIQLDDCVTLFTGSDFARTLTSNGKGSDHAWGSNQLVVGGAVNGGLLYGSYPNISLDSEDDLGRGRFVPTTACDLYFAELALWFGVSPSDLSAVLPNVENFYQTGGSAPLGFMQSV